jgi:hypothetical protein
MLKCGSGSNTAAGWRTLKAAAEVKIAAAANILLYYYSVILVGCVFALLL